MTANKKIPALRFKEFEGEWEERKLGEMCSTFKSGNGITGNEIKETGNFPVYGGNGLRGYTNSYTHDGFYVLIGRQGALCGNINRAVGKTFISEHAIAVQANELSDSEWLAQKLDLMKLNQYSESSAQPGLSVNKLVKLKINSPTLSEQQKIGTFLTSIDDKTQQLTKKKALLEQYKKGVMQQIFNQQIRFKDDNENDYPAWEEKKLSELLIEYRLGGNYANTEEKTEFLLIKMGNINRGSINLEKLEYIPLTEEINALDKIQYGDLFFNTRNTLDLVGKVAIWRNELPKAYYNSNLMLFKFQNNFFMNYRLNSFEGLKALKSIATGTTSVAAIYTKDLLHVKLSIPIIQEQQKIANFLSGIDNKIDLVNQQLEKTKEFKKGLLQQMFV